jgi:hypothetical protein
MLEHAYLIPLLPLAASVLILFLAKSCHWAGHWIGILAVGWGVVQSFGILGIRLSEPGPVAVGGCVGALF